MGSEVKQKLQVEENIKGLSEKFGATVSNPFMKAGLLWAVTVATSTLAACLIIKTFILPGA